MEQRPSNSASVSELVQFGRELRSSMPRRNHAELILPSRDSIEIMERQHADRLPDLVPVRVARMLESPFAFYRGSAALMAHDLADAPVTGIDVIACGDAHISNFGWYGTPERSLAFDLNDFDEASNAPWEWDLKRLAASAFIAARENGLDQNQAWRTAKSASSAYRTWIANLMEKTPMERFYFQVDSEMVAAKLRGEDRKTLKKDLKKVRGNTSARALSKINVIEVDGVARIEDEPPLLVHQDDVTTEMAQELVMRYIGTVRSDVAMLLSHFTVVDVALRVVGVGSVGTRCYIVLLKGPTGEPLLVQVKEAQKSVLETWGKRVPRLLGKELEQKPGFNGRRIVASQRALQATSDPFLGYFHGSKRDFYARQFRDMKGSVEIATLSPTMLTQYVELCGAMLARGHSQSPTAGIIHGYLDGSKRFDDAIADWSAAYYNVVLRDFQDLQTAVKKGRVPVADGM